MPAFAKHAVQHDGVAVGAAAHDALLDGTVLEETVTGPIGTLEVVKAEQLDVVVV